MKKLNFNHTIYAGYVGYIVQAIVNNFAPLLFLTFAAEYGLGLEKITLLTTVNFVVQLTVDFLAAKFVDKIGYRASVIMAHAFAAVGLAGFAVCPEILPDAYTGLLVAVVCAAIGSGMLEVVISPLVEGCVTEKKEAAMSLLHSAYSWGHVLIVVVSTVFFVVMGTENWKILAVLWAIVPVLNIIAFAFVPINPPVSEAERIPLLSLIKKKLFWILVLIMVCAGASEMAMSQWASAFAEDALGVTKTIGDLAGPCAFAIFMGIARTLHGKFSEKLPLRKMMIASAVLCVICYGVTALSTNPVISLIGCAVCGFSVGIFWPGTYSMAAEKMPLGGTGMYALLALAGDFGCTSGPTLVGMISSAAGDNLKAGLGVAMLFPALLLVGVLLVKKVQNKN